MEDEPRRINPDQPPIGPLEHDVFRLTPEAVDARMAYDELRSLADAVRDLKNSGASDEAASLEERLALAKQELLLADARRFAAESAQAPKPQDT